MVKTTHELSRLSYLGHTPTNSGRVSSGIEKSLHSNSAFGSQIFVPPQFQHFCAILTLKKKRAKPSLTNLSGILLKNDQNHFELLKLRENN